MAVPVMDEARLRRAFLDDAEDLSLRLGSTLQALDADRRNLPLINEVFRLTHSLKSESALMGFSVLSGLAHGMEDVLGLARDAAFAIDKPVMERLFAAADLIAEMMGAIGRGGSDADFDVSTAMRALSGFTERVRGGHVAGRTPARPPAVAADEKGSASGAFAVTDTLRDLLREARDRGETAYLLTLSVDEEEAMKFPRVYLAVSNLETHVNVVAVSPGVDGEPANDAAYGHTAVLLTSATGIDAVRAAVGVDQVRVDGLRQMDYGELLGRRAAEPAAAGRSAPSAVPSPGGDDLVQRPGGAEKATIRVDTQKLDDLWSLIAELVVHKAHIGRLSDDLGRGADAQAVREKLTDSFDSLDKIAGGMQQVMMDTRMIPISVIFSKFPRLVRDLSRKLGKSVDLVVEGGDTEIDRGIVEALSDPLTHIIRNALDHGIEFPEERVRVGKPERGRVNVSARRQGGSIVIELADDGRGMDLEGIRRKAVERGIPRAASLNESQLLDLVFLPGFSTRDVVTDLSGRGVGMDVVATRIRGDLKGEVTLKSDKGRGTRLTLQLPLTLTIVNALLVKGDGQVYAIPLTDVDSTTTLLGTELRGERGAERAAWEGEELPVFSLGELLGGGRRPAEEHTVAVLRDGDRRAFLIVDELIEEREVVIKPLDDLLNGERLLSGVSVLEDGGLVFILDTSFIRREHSREEDEWAPPS